MHSQVLTTMHRCQLQSLPRSCASRIQGGIRYIYHPTSGGRSNRVCLQSSPHPRMSPVSSSNSLQQPHRHDESSSEFQDIDSHPSVDTNIDPPGWERLIHTPLAKRERISLITTIFSNQDEVRMAKRLHGEDARIFIDVTYGVRSYNLPSPKNGAIDFDSNFRILSIRCWMISITRCG